MLESLAAITVKCLPALMLGSGVVIAAAQDVAAPVPDGWMSVVTAIGQALITGGGLAVVGAFLLKRTAIYMDARNAAAVDERTAERAERERQYADHKDTTMRYIVSLETRVQVLDERLDRFIGTVLSRANSKEER